MRYEEIDRVSQPDAERAAETATAEALTRVLIGVGSPLRINNQSTHTGLPPSLPDAPGLPRGRSRSPLQESCSPLPGCPELGPGSSHVRLYSRRPSSVPPALRRPVPQVLLDLRRSQLAEAAQVGARLPEALQPRPDGCRREPLPDQFLRRVHQVRDQRRR